VRPDQRIFQILTKVRPQPSTYIIIIIVYRCCTRLYSIGIIVATCGIGSVSIHGNRTSSARLDVLYNYYYTYRMMVWLRHKHTLYTHYTHTHTLTQVPIYTYKRDVIILYGLAHARAIYIIIYS